MTVRFLLLLVALWIALSCCSALPVGSAAGYPVPALALLPQNLCQSDTCS